MISISATDKQNTKIIVENNRISEVRPKSNKKVSTTQLLELETTQVFETQIKTVREEYQASSNLQELIINTTQAESTEIQEEISVELDRESLNQAVRDIAEEVLNQMLDEGSHKKKD